MEGGAPEKSWLIQVMPWRLWLSCWCASPSMATCQASYSSGAVASTPGMQVKALRIASAVSPRLSFACT